MITCLVNAVEGITVFVSVALKCCLDLNKSGMLKLGTANAKVLRQRRDQRNGKELGVPEEW